MTKRLLYGTVTVGILAFLTGYLGPLWGYLDAAVIKNISADPHLTRVIARSIGFGLVSASVCVLMGLLGAMLVRRVMPESVAGKWLSVLSVPFLLGNASVAFLFKLLLLDAGKAGAFADSSMLFTLLLVFQVWQYGSLFLYLFWMSIQRLDDSALNYADVIGLNPFERFRDIILPHVRSLLMLLMLIAFVFSVYEDIKLQLVFNASPGTGSELVSHYMYRQFRSDLLIGFDHAAAKVVNAGLGTVLPLALLAFILIASGLHLLMLLFFRNRWSIQIPIPTGPSISAKIPSAIILFIVLAPLPVAVAMNGFRMPDSLTALCAPLLYTVIAASVAAMLAIVFALAVRMWGRYRMNGFNASSIFLIAALFLLQLAPPILLLIAGFRWMEIFDMRSTMGVLTLWTIGHAVLALPVLGSFVLISHFKVSARELDYLDFAKVSGWKKIYWSFLARFKAEYLLTFIFAFSIIWNESLLNRVFSDHVPSFVSVLMSAVRSRSADYSVAFGFLGVSLLLATLCVFLWLFAQRDKENVRTA
jgi:ABC-type sugar transport system permease subunit